MGATCVSVLPSGLLAPFYVRFLFMNFHAFAQTRLHTCVSACRDHVSVVGQVGSWVRTVSLHVSRQRPLGSAHRDAHVCVSRCSAPPVPWARTEGPSRSVDTSVFFSISQLLHQCPDGDSREYRSEKWCTYFCVVTSLDSADRWTGHLGAAGASCRPPPPEDGLSLSPPGSHWSFAVSPEPV